MSTPELPGELRLALGQAPTPSSPLPATSASPGVALAELRVPGAPTVPDPDPLGLAALIQRHASGLFAAPPTAGVPSAASAPSAASVPSAASGPPAASVPSPTPDVPASAPSAPAAAPPAISPFTAPLQLDAIVGLAALAPVASFPLLDAAPAAVPAIAPASAPIAWQLDAADRPSLSTATAAGLDPHVVRSQFPILDERIHGKRLVWLDNAATTQKPRVVIDRLRHFYEHENSNIHRAAHTLAARATDAYEGARDSVARFLHAPSSKDIVFVRGTTEAINLVAQAWGRANVGAGDEIVITWLEHHANIVPWQQLCAERGARLRVAPVDDDGQIILSAYERLLGPRTRLVALSQVSNALGTITPAPQMVAMAHQVGARVLVDGAQSVSHLPTDVLALDCDFFVFSGHKVFAPTGIGALYGKPEVLAAMPPWQGGGNMIADVTFDHTVFQDPPARFEAGTGNIADAVGLGAALDWLEQLGVANVGAYEHGLLEYATARLHTVPGLRMIGTAPAKAGVLSFVLAGHRPDEVGRALDRDGIAVRSGHHCAQPILRRFGLEATVRASLAPYNTCEDIDALVESLLRFTRGAA